MAVVYALFKDVAQGRAAHFEIQELRSRTLRVRMHDEEPNVDDMSLAESGMKRGLIDGVLFGSLGAGALVLLFSWFGIVQGGALTVFVALGLGAFYGLLVGLVAGTSSPDRNLGQLFHELDDGVLLTVESGDPDALFEANRILTERGAVTRRPESI